MNKIVMHVNSLHFRRAKREIFSDLTFSIEAGQFISLIGPNGTGKSTLLKLLAGILKVDRGEILLFNQDISSLKSRDIAKQITYMPQTTHLETNFTVMQVVEMGRNKNKNRFSNWDPNDASAVQYAMDLTGITHLKDRFVPSLSGGERQLVYLAKTIAQDTPILLLDEPTSDLDIHHQVIVQNIIKTLVENGKTVIAAIHDINLATRISDKCMLLKDGIFIAYDEPNEIIQANYLEKTFNVKSHIYEEQFSHKKQIIPYEVLK